MPLYEYRCADGHVTDEYRTIDERARPAVCAKCHGQADKIISRVGHAVPDISPYRSVIDGSVINSRSSHRAHLRQHGCIEVGNERLPERAAPKPEGVRDDINRAWEQAK